MTETGLTSLTEDQGPLVGDPEAITVDLLHRLGEREYLQVRCYARPVVDEGECVDTVLIQVQAVAVSYRFSTASGSPRLVWSNIDAGGLASMVFPLRRAPMDDRHEVQGFPLAVLATCPIAEDWTPAEVALCWLAAVRWDTALNDLCIEEGITPWLDLGEQ